MITGDTITTIHLGIPVEVIIIDDCYRVTDEKCTMLVKLTNEPYTEFEIDSRENESGKDI